jgi:NADH-quinone oxidoreductase subunit G
MPKIKINGREMEVAAGVTVLQAALENGIYVPHFCYHPFLRISGNCRMCLVDIKPGPPKLSIACNTVVADNMEIDTVGAKVQEARKSVMEFLLKNHPVDCPICDKAGECTLQDYYMLYDLQTSRVSPQEKVKKKKAQRVGKRLVLDSERCILCTRCVRFMAEVIKDECLVIMNRRDQSEVTTFPGKEVDNPYSLNLTDICPVGAWTGQDFRFKQRVWFLESTPSICPTCARGCNILLEKRRGEIYRMRPRVNALVNRCWLCDEGRLNYHSIDDHRFTAPFISGEAGRNAVGWEEALAKAAGIIREAGANLKVVVSASLSQEEGRAVIALFKEKLGATLLLHTGEPGWSDDFLRQADMNANTRGLTELGIGEKLTAAVDGPVLLLDTLCPKPLPGGMVPAIAISPQSSPAVDGAKVALPAASYAETSGTFVNFEGIAQRFERALPPRGQALPYLEILARLAAALGYKLAA